MTSRISSKYLPSITARSLVATAILTATLSAVSVFAVEVIEAEPTIVSESPRHRSTRPISTSAANRHAAPVETNVAAQMYVELQRLQTEVMQLRGMVEEQSHTIQQLQQRRMDDYLEFDRRIAELGGGSSAASDTSTVSRSTAGAASPSPSPAAASATTSQRPIAASGADTAMADSGSTDSDTSRGAYRAAYQLVKDRQFVHAKKALSDFVIGHPDSSYVPNSQFWLGEIYYLESDLEQSRRAFSVLIVNYPQHRKVPDAKFKLGKIYHQLGDKSKAKEMLESVVNDHSDSKAANPAREYLKNSLR